MALLASKNSNEMLNMEPPIYSGSSAPRSFLCFAVALFFLFASASFVKSEDAAAYRIKAVFLYNFAQFTAWPDSAFSNPKAPFVIGVLGKDPFGTVLDATVKEEHINGHPIEIRRFANLTEMKECHILFISQSEQGRMIPIIDSLAGKPVLTVGDTERFARDGGMIRFVSESNKIRFRINVGAAENAKLVISSKLLRLADIVKTERNRP